MEKPTAPAPTKKQRKKDATVERLVTQEATREDSQVRTMEKMPTQREALPDLTQEQQPTRDADEHQPPKAAKPRLKGSSKRRTKTPKGGCACSYATDQ